MKHFIFVFLLAFVLIANGSDASLTYFSPLRAVVYPASHVYSAHSSSLITPTQNQYHTQDEFGQYAYGYNEPLSAKQEVRSLDGVTRGSYRYRDAEGKLQTVAYTADSDGFHVAATNLPREVSPPEQLNIPESTASVTDTVEVASASNAHSSGYQAVKLRLSQSESNTMSDGSEPLDDNNFRSAELPKTVEDTPDVAAARAQHLKLLEQGKLRNAIIGSAASIYPQVAAFGYRTYAYPLSTRILAPAYYF